MSEDAPGGDPGALDPAIGLVELDSVVAGIVAGDAMVKASPVGSIYAGTVHPGRYLVLVSGDTASVEVALDVGRRSAPGSLLDSIFLPDIHPSVTRALVGEPPPLEGDALGIIEAATVATVIGAADAGVKAADVRLATVELADGLGGKGYALFGGLVADVEAAVDQAADRAESGGHVLTRQVIAQLHGEMRHNLLSDLRFNARLRLRAQER